VTTRSIGVLLRFAGAFLLLTGVAKLHLVIAKSAAFRHLEDPITGLNVRTLLIALVFFEIGLGLWLSFAKWIDLSCVLLSAFSEMLLAYRMIAYLFDESIPCPCLGFLGNLLPRGVSLIVPLLAALVMTVFPLLYLRSSFPRSNPG
jgi:hypothetical protein